MQEDTSPYASRKFILTGFLMLSALALLLMKAIDSATWQAVSLGSLGIYGLANVSQKFSNSETQVLVK